MWLLTMQSEMRNIKIAIGATRAEAIDNACKGAEADEEVLGCALSFKEAFKDSDYADFNKQLSCKLQQFTGVTEVRLLQEDDYE